MKVSLRQVSNKCGQLEYQMFQDIGLDENGFTNPAYNLPYCDFLKWIKQIINHSKGKDLPCGWVPSTTYILYIDDTPVGYGRIRHQSVPYLENVVGAGNLGYAIAKSYRGKGYGNIILSEMLKKCKKIGYKKIKLYPYKTNEKSLKIMFKNGGEIIGDFKGEKYIVEIII